MVYQIEQSMERKSFMIANSKLLEFCSAMYGVLWVVSFLELCVVVCCAISSVLWIANTGFIPIRVLEFLNISILTFVWTLIPCILFGIIERDLEIPDSCLNEQELKIVEGKRMADFYASRW